MESAPLQKAKQTPALESRHPSAEVGSIMAPPPFQLVAGPPSPPPADRMGNEGKETPPIAEKDLTPFQFQKAGNIPPIEPPPPANGNNGGGNMGNGARGTVQRVQWDTVAAGRNSYKTELFGGINWRPYTVLTDAGSSIEVFKGESRLSREEASGSGQLMMTRGGDAGLYNCHGFTFGGHLAPDGTYGILDSGPVRQILADEYRQIPMPFPGCVVVFGDADHTGIVDNIEEGGGSLEERVMVESKLGTKDRSVESIADLSRFGPATFYAPLAGGGEGEEAGEVDELEAMGVFEVEVGEIEERARGIEAIEEDMEDLYRLQDILDQLIKGKKLSEEDMAFYERLKAEGENEGAVLQAKSIQFQQKNSPGTADSGKQSSKNKTGLSDGLKEGVETLSGHSMDDVKVHFNSNKPAQLQAHAYAQGTEIHLGPGQEKHLPHEAWHVAQQKQGRVQPTTQMKGKVPVNDDAGLEKEADEMGAKAAQLKASSPASEPMVSAKLDKNAPAQRVINLNAEPKTVEEVMELIGPMFKTAEQRELVRNRILPALDRNNPNYGSANDLWGQLIIVVDLLLPWMNFDPAMPLRDLVARQMLLQTDFKNLGASGGFQYLMTTVGFEHEFADMVSGPLAGVSHLELAKSTESMPLTKIPFILETDAANALELVSPPFLLPTIDGVPLPDPAIVGAIDAILRRELSTVRPAREVVELSLHEQLMSRPGKEEAEEGRSIHFIDMLRNLGRIIGFDFRLTDLEIKPEHLSHNATPGVLAQVLGTPEAREEEMGAGKGKAEETGEKLGEAGPSSLHLNPEILLGMQVEQSRKAKKETDNISSQVNFATDLGTANLLMGPTAVGGAKVYQDLEREMREGINVAGLNQPAVQLFSNFMVKSLCGLFSVYSQYQVRQTQARFYAAVQREMASPGTMGKGAFGEIMPGKEKNDFVLHTLLSSFVKDSNPIWVKDHLESLAFGLLKTPEDFLEATQLAKAALGFIQQWAPPESAGGGLIKKGHANPAAHWEDFFMNLLTVIPQLILSLDDGGVRLGAQKDKTTGSDLYEHDPRVMGARQDTYLDPQKVQQSDLWDNRLHVAEIRRGNPAEQLAEARGRLNPDA